MSTKFCSQWFQPLQTSVETSHSKTTKNPDIAEENKQRSQPHLADK